MTPPLDHRDGGEVEGEPGGGLEGPNPALAHHHRTVALFQDVLCRAEPLLDATAESAFQQYGYSYPPGLRQQHVILRIAGTDLEHVDVLGHLLHMTGIDDLGNDREANGPPRVGQQLYPIPLHALE